jgi:CRP-like cAMP-binding protein
LGEQLTNELVDWFNQVDATYRSDLRELNELNFARFDAKMEQRFAEADARLERRFAQYEAKWEQRFAHVEATMDRRFAEADAKLEQAVASLRGEMRTGFAEQRSDLLRWMFVYWGSSVVTTIGLVLLVLKAVT